MTRRINLNLAEHASGDIGNAVVGRQPVVQKCVVRLDQIEHAPIVLQHIPKQKFRFQLKRLTQVVIEVGKEAEVAGAFGEAAFERAWARLGGRLLGHVGAYEFDYRERTIGEIEVKTKPRSVRPEPHYQAGVAVANLEFQHPSAFVFVSLYPKAEAPFFRYEEAWIVGWMSDAEFRERSVLVPKGSTMGGGGASFRDMRDVDLAQLRPIEELILAGYP